MSYAAPGNSGLGSDRRACQKVIKMVLDVLAYPENRFESVSLPKANAWDEKNDGVSFEHDCKMFRMKLFQRLKTDGWMLHYDENGLLVNREK